MDESRTDLPAANEPVPAVPGGRGRASRLADTSGLPVIAARKRVVEHLLAHDRPESDNAFEGLTDADYVLVRVIAQEGAATRMTPALRFSALAALGARPSAANINLLTDLARFGEDFYVRGHAVLALGSTGSYAHLPALMAGLRAAEPFERLAAASAINRLVAATSLEAVLAHVQVLGEPSDAERVREALAAKRRAEAGRPAHPVVTTSRTTAAGEDAAD
jgi:hypothetical protein